MKKLIILAAGIFSMLSSIAQDAPAENPNAPLTKEDYLKKSRGQKTGAIVLIAVGGAMVVGGAVIATNELGNDLDGLFDSNYDDSDNSNDAVSVILVVGGLAAMLGSIPLFISSHKNKKRAMSMSFQNIPVNQVQKNMVMQQLVPSLSLKISL